MSKNRQLMILTTCLLVSVAVYADDGLPIVEVKADRTILYPQRMKLNGEETLMDVLQMVPDLLMAGYEDVISDYNLRIDNVPVNGDERLILTQMKARDIDKIQVCNNTGVAKGTIGTLNVLDITMKMPDKLSGFVEGQGIFGRMKEGNGTVNVLYGSKSTDIYANATYRYQEGNKDYVTFHMTNRFDDRNRLLTFFTQQFIEQPYNMTRKVMGRARYFHTFNDMGTELLLVGGYQYSSDPRVSNTLPLYIVELNTPLFTKRLSMMVGNEGDYLTSTQKDREWSWSIFNNDIYLQFTYTLPQWRFTAGHRTMFYGYKLMGEGDTRKFTDTRHNTNACAIYVPNSRNQLQLGYYRKYYNPSYEILFLNTITLSYQDWLLIEGQLEEWNINQFKLGYTYSKPNFTLQTDASYYVVEGEDNYAQVNASAYWKTGCLSLTGGAHLYFAADKVYATLRTAPTFYLPYQWQIGMQLVYFTKRTLRREWLGTTMYGSLSVNKLFGKHWLIGAEWHDMFDDFLSGAVINRHSANIKLQYRF